MAYREVSVMEIKEVLRLWLAGQSLREVTRLAGVDRKTVRRYVLAAQASGVAREGGDGRLSDEVLGARWWPWSDRTGPEVPVRPGR
jgi:hypothetical protein